MREDFLHYLWRWRKFDLTNLQTTNRQALEIIHPGTHNTDAGPDFFNARIRLGNTMWAGNIEIHLNASDWWAHQHHQDVAYQNVILHVVYCNDCPDSPADLPCLELQNRIPLQLLEQYQQFVESSAAIPCATSLHQVPEIVKLNWLDRLLADRLETKTAPILEALHRTENHWEEVFYRHLASSFGLKINVQPFEQLAYSLPVQTLGKHKNQLFQLEALIFGQAGMLAEPTDDYHHALAKEYRFLQRKYELTPLHISNWKFLRLRPANFPTIRLAQFAMLVHRAQHLFSKTLEMKTARELQHLFDVGVSDYWQEHYVFGKKSIARPKNLGKNFTHLLLVNTVIPFIFLYGKLKNQPDLQDHALHLLEQLPAEKNHLIDDWANIGVAPRHAFEAQALLHLRKNFCDARRCLDCAMGHFLLR